MQEGMAGTAFSKGSRRGNRHLKTKLVSSMSNVKKSGKNKAPEAKRKAKKENGTSSFQSRKSSLSRRCLIFAQHKAT